MLGSYQLWDLVLYELRMENGPPLIQPPNDNCEGYMLEEHHHESFPKILARQASHPLE
jgi:hypothetical protein